MPDPAGPPSPSPCLPFLCCCMLLIVVWEAPAGPEVSDLGSDTHHCCKISHWRVAAVCHCLLVALLPLPLTTCLYVCPQNPSLHAIGSVGMILPTERQKHPVFRRTNVRDACCESSHNVFKPLQPLFSFLTLSDPPSQLLFQPLLLEALMPWFTTLSPK